MKERLLFDQQNLQQAIQQKESIITSMSEEIAKLQMEAEQLQADVDELFTQRTNLEKLKHEYLGEIESLKVREYCF